MAEFDIPPPPEELSGWDANNLMNVLIGINRSVDGVRQAYEVAKEAIGLTKPGTARFVTEQLKQDQRDIASESGFATQRPGAGGLQFAGEILPFLTVPLGATVGRAAGIGGLLGGTMFQDDLDNTGRLVNMAAGSALGGLFGKFLRPRKPGGGAVDDFDSVPRNRSLVPNNSGANPVHAFDAIHPVKKGASSPAAALPPPRGMSGRQLVPASVGDATRGLIHNTAKGLRAEGLSRMIENSIVKGEIDRAFVMQAREQVVKKQQDYERAFKTLDKANNKTKDELIKDRLNAEKMKLDKEKAAGEELIHRMDELLDDPGKYLPTVVAEKLRKPNRTRKPTNVKGGRQRGEADPKTLAMVAGGGVGGLAGASVSDENPLMGFFGGALAGAALVPILASAPKWMNRKGVRDASRQGSDFNEKMSTTKKAGIVTKSVAHDAIQSAHKILDDFLGATDMRIRMISPSIAAALRATEFNTHSIAGNWIREGEKFFTMLEKSKLTEQQQRSFKGLLSNDRKKAEAYLRRKGANAEADELQTIGRTLDDVAGYLKANGLGKNLRPNYFPRRVVDTTQFESIPEVDSYFQYLVEKKKIAELTDFEKQEAITELLNGALKSNHENVHFINAAKSLKRRKVGTVKSDTVDAYADPKQAYNGYIEEIVKHVETQKFFNGQGIADVMTPNSANLNNIVAKMGKQLRDGGMNLKEAEEVTELLRMRFGPGEMAPHKLVQNFKNLTYTGLLGNPIAAITQIGDLALSMHKNGIINTSRALVKVLGERGKPMSNGLDKETLLGLRDAAQDFAGNEMNTRKILDWGLKYSGFRGADRLGKNTFINASMSKQLQRSKDDFMQEWKPWFEGETEALWNDVQSFAKDGLTNANKDRIGLMLWNTLSDVQPISLSTLPKKYLQHPNGRMAYMLQSFTLRLFNTMREDIIQKAGRKDYKGALKNTIRLGSFFTLLNGGTDALKDFVLGRDMKGMDELMVNNLLKLGGLNKFTLDRAASQGVGTAMLQQAGPPMALFDTFGDAKKAVGMLPIGGRFIKEAMQ